MSFRTEKFYTCQVYVPSFYATMSHPSDIASEEEKRDDFDVQVISNTIPGDIGEFKNLTHLSIAVEWSFLVRMRIAEPLVVETTKSLSVHMSRSIENLPPEICQLRRLERLELDCLDQLEFIPSRFGSLQALQEIHINRCQRLRNLPESLADIKSLKMVTVEYCTGLQVLPVSLQSLKLNKLHLSGLARDVIIQFFARPWNNQGSVDQICIHDCELSEHYSKILAGLPRSLIHLSVHDNGIDTIDGFLEQGLPIGIRRLSLNDNPILNSDFEKDRLALQRLLGIYTLLGQIGWWCFREKTKLVTPKLQYLLLLNKCGRALLSDQKPVPLSVWPTVLEGIREAATKQRPRNLEDTITDSRNGMEASVVYALLQGPAFLNRSWGQSIVGRKRSVREDPADTRTKRTAL